MYHENQCDGCARKHPRKHGLHYNPDSGLPEMACTERLYGPDVKISCPLGDSCTISWIGRDGIGWFHSVKEHMNYGQTEG